MQKLPGINSKNIDTFLRRSTNLDKVLKLNEDELKEILGNAVDAQALYSALHNDHNPKKEIDSQNKNQKTKRKFIKKK